MHVMLDIETLSTQKDAPIISIGATLFDPRVSDTYDALFDRAFLRRIDISDTLDHCGPVEGGTLRWWFEQDPEAIKALVGTDTVSLKTGLIDFSNYCNSRDGSSPLDEEYRHYPKAVQVWAKSPDFDCTIMQHACNATNVIYPFGFWDQRCVRTLQDLAWPNGSDRPVFGSGRGVAHDARHDAVVQAMMVQAGFKELDLAIPGAAVVFKK